MTSRKLLTLLTVALLTTSVLTQSKDFEYQCTHGEGDYHEPDFIEVDEQWSPDGNNDEERRLQEYSNLRAVGYYGFLQTSVSYFQYDLIPPILDYFSATLKVKYPVNGQLRVNTQTVCGKMTPSVLRNGVNADYVFMIETYSQPSTVVAATQICSAASGSGRPLVAYSRFNSYNLRATSDVLLHEKNMVCIMHEVTHSLGFTVNMYPYYLNANGQRQSGLLVNANLDGSTSLVLTAEPLRTMLREHFGCPSLLGAYMENTGGSGTTAQHFERRIFSFEYMTSGLIYEMQVSKFTLGLLESTGWYVPNYNNADDFHWGKGQGCSFVTGRCSASSFDEFCATSARSCTNPGKSSGTCQADARSDGCQFIHPDIYYHCDNPAAINYATLPSAEVYGRGENSRCFGGTLGRGYNSGFCFQSSCSGSGANTELTVRVGSKTAICTKAGAISVSGYSGYLECPDPQTFCQSAAKCPRGCMGRGNCVNGQCQCFNGFKGVDCALRSSF